MKNNNHSVKTLVLMALFAAISIILTRFASVMLFGGTVRLGFGNIPIIYAGLLLGPVAGGIVGFVSDIIGVMIFPMGSFNPGVTLSAVLYGMVPGVVAIVMQKRDSWLVITISNFLVYIIVSMGLMTYSLSYFQWNVFLAKLPLRAPWQALISVVSVMVIKILMEQTKALVKDI